MPEDQLEKFTIVGDLSRQNLSVDAANYAPELQVASTASDTASLLGNVDTNAQPERVLEPEVQKALLSTLKNRWKVEPEHYERPDGIDYQQVLRSIEADPAVMYGLHFLELTGGMVDVVGENDGEYILADCSYESPVGRRGLTFTEAEAQAAEFGTPIILDADYEQYLGNLIGKRANSARHSNFDDKTFSYVRSSDGSAMQADRCTRGLCTISSCGSDHVEERRGWRSLVKVKKVD